VGKNTFHSKKICVERGKGPNNKFINRQSTKPNRHNSDEEKGDVGNKSP